MDGRDIEATAEKFILGIECLISTVESFLSDLSKQRSLLSVSATNRKLELYALISLIKAKFPPTILIKSLLVRAKQNRMAIEEDRNNNRERVLVETANKTKDSSIDQQSSRCCLCNSYEKSRFCVVPRSASLNQMRCLQYSRVLLARIENSTKDRGNNSLPKFIVNRNDLLKPNYSGWLSVDEDHSYYAVISDCLLCLFENGRAEISLMTVILNGRRAERVQSADSGLIDDMYAFTIMKDGDETDSLYFYCESSSVLEKWITWVNVASQLQLQDLVDCASPQKACTEHCKDNFTQTEKSATASVGTSTTCRRQRKEDPNQLAHRTSATVRLERLSTCTTTSDASGAPSGYSTAVHSEDNSELEEDAIVTTRKRKSRALEYDWNLDQGINRRFLSMDKLNQDLRLRKSMSMIEDCTTSPTRVPCAPGYLQSTLDIKPVSVPSNKGEEQETTPNRSTTLSTKRKRLMERAASLFLSRSDSANLVTKEQQQGRESEEIMRRRSQNLGTNSHTVVDMTSVYEIEGYLLMKRLLGWSAVYCSVYNGIFSYYKDISSSMPEVQWYLSDCRVTPSGQNHSRKPFSFKLRHRSKTLQLSAISDVAMHAWYSIFNKHIKGALALSKHRGGAYPFWPADGDVSIYRKRRPVSQLDYTSSFNLPVARPKGRYGQSSFHRGSETELEDLKENDSLSVDENSAHFSLSLDNDKERDVTDMLDGSCENQAESSDNTLTQIAPCSSSEDSGLGILSSNSHQKVDSGESPNKFSGEQTSRRPSSNHHSSNCLQATELQDQRRNSFSMSYHFRKAARESTVSAQSRSLNDLTALRYGATGSTSDEGELSSDDESDASGLQIRNTNQTREKQKKSSNLSPEDRRQKLLEKMINEKERLERRLNINKSDNQSENFTQCSDEFDAEMLKQMTRLQQRRVSNQLKYDYLEKQLRRDKGTDKSKSSGVFHLGNHTKHEKQHSTNHELSEANDLHIRKQMTELKQNMDSIDKGESRKITSDFLNNTKHLKSLTETKTRHEECVYRALHNRPAVMSSANNRPTPPPHSQSTLNDDALSKHRLRGLESIIETLDSPKASKHINSVKNSPIRIKQRPHSIAAFGSAGSCDSVEDGSLHEEKLCSPEVQGREDKLSPPVLQVSAEAMAVINEFETMTRELLNHRPSVNFH